MICSDRRLKLIALTSSCQMRRGYSLLTCWLHDVARAGGSASFLERTHTSLACAMYEPKFVFAKCWAKLSNSKESGQKKEVFASSSDE